VPVISAPKNMAIRDILVWTRVWVIPVLPVYVWVIMLIILISNVVRQKLARALVKVMLVWRRALVATVRLIGLVRLEVIQPTH